MKHRIRRRIVASLLSGGLLAATAGRHATLAAVTPPEEQPMLSGTDQDPLDGEIASHAIAPVPAAAVAKGKNDADLVVAPIPRHDPSQGWGVLAIAQYIFKPTHQAKQTPPSVAGLVAFYTEEKSYGGCFGYLGHWKDDLWRPIFGAGYMKLNYDFYGIGTEAAELDVAIPVEQEITFAAAQAMRRIQPHLYAGLRISATATKVETEAVSVPSGMIPPQDRELETWSGGPVAQWDSRDNQFYPTSGHLANLSIILSGGSREYQIYRADWNYYHSLGESIVLAFRGTLRIADGDVPFYALSQFGQRSDLRGYTNGKYRDRDLVAVQGEYRQRLSGRWGFVVFAGVGEVVPAISELNTDDLLASGGAGLRFRLSRQNPVNLRLDWAYGKDGSATYVSVNEAF